MPTLKLDDDSTHSTRSLVCKCGRSLTLTQRGYDGVAEQDDEVMGALELAAEELGWDAPPSRRGNTERCPSCK